MTFERNVGIAKTFAYPDQNVVFIMGERDGLDIDAARKIQQLFMDLGFFVHEITPEDFNIGITKKIESFTKIGRFAVIPHAESFSVEYKECIEKFVTDGGKLIILGGPLFGAYDTSIKVPAFEGISPFYKLYYNKNCKNIKSAGSITDAVLDLGGEQVDIVCPVARSDGYGFNTDRNARIIPFAEALSDKDEPFARNGRVRGLAAYIALTDTDGHLVRTNATRAGTVSCTAVGRSFAVVGIKKQDLLAISGMKQLLTDMITSFAAGDFLFESGADKYVCRPGESVNIGARILSTAVDHKRGSVNVRIKKGDETKLERTFDTMLAAQNFCRVSCEIQLDISSFSEGIYNVETELVTDGKVIDRTNGELLIQSADRQLLPEDVVTVKDGEFMLDGKIWRMYGFNYWPLYHVSLEHKDYWRGEFDIRNYIPCEVDKDLKQIHDMGMNCVAVRLDGGSFERVVQPLMDFFARCEKYNLKVMFGACNLTNPMFFQGDAFKYLLETTGIHKSPSMFSYDLAWEVGTQFGSDGYVQLWRAHWEKWLCEQFGSVEKAEEVVGFKFHRTSGGDLRCPFSGGFTSSGAEATYTKLFTRFLNNFASRCYRDAVKEIRKIDPVHLFGSRAAPTYENVPNIVVSGVNKHIDYHGLEGYTQTFDEVGISAGCAVTKAAQFLSKGKPVTWIEYGISLVGVSGLAADTKPKFDMEALQPYEEKYQEAAEYQRMFNKIFELCDVKGTLPWFYAGGFRSTEHSDCGHINPDGTLRPVAKAYLEAMPAFMSAEKTVSNRKKLLVDPDSDPATWSHIIYGKGLYNKMVIERTIMRGETPNLDRVHGEGLVACLDLVKNGEDFEFVTTGTGTNSENVPLEPSANINVEVMPDSLIPLKYLDAEFNSVTLEYIDGGKICTIEVVNGENVVVPKDVEKVKIFANVGNLGEATWLKKDGFGGVYIGSFGSNRNFRMSISADTVMFDDAQASGVLELCGESNYVRLRTFAEGRATFGEIFEFTISK